MIGPFPMELEKLETKALYVATVRRDDGRVFRQSCQADRTFLPALAWVTYQLALHDFSTAVTQ